MSYGSDFVLTLFTNDTGLAAAGDKAGINRIGLDLETIGKQKRQDPTKAWVSDHEIHQLQEIREVLKTAALFTRTNPIHEGSRDEIDRLIGEGVQVLMLPMFRTIKEAGTFVDLVNGRATVVLLVETATAAMRLREIVTIPGVDEIHFGLNDMYLDMNLSNHFEVLASGLLDMLADVVSSAGLLFGFAGIGRVRDDRLPMPPSLIYAQYPRLGATRALVARVFYSPDYREFDLTREIAAARDALDLWHQAGRNEQDLALASLREMVRGWVV
jgi:hypothetical protein